MERASQYSPIHEERTPNDPLSAELCPPSDGPRGEGQWLRSEPALCARCLVEAQREASRLRDRHDSFINEADGRDQPVDLKPQAREVRSKATGL